MSYWISGDIKLAGYRVSDECIRKYRQHDWFPFKSEGTLFARLSLFQSVRFGPCKLDLTTMDWRRIPSLSALRAFEAVLRTGGISRAAAELNVTHAAISQHVRALENELGLPLVQRNGAGTQGTPEGEDFGRSLSAAFAMVSDSVEELRAANSPSRLTISTTPAFAESWLMPRLGSFWAKHPSIQLNLIPSKVLTDFRTDRVDLAVRYGAGKWPGLISEHLFDAAFVVVATPDLVKKHHLSTTADFSGLPWLFEAGQAEQFSWAVELGLDPTKASIQEFSTNTLVLAATRSGYGVSVQSSTLIRDDLDAGTLEILASEPSSSLGYHIVRLTKALRVDAQSFVSWLNNEIVKTGGK